MDMIENITVEQIAAAVIFIGGLYAGVKYLKKELKDAIVEMLKDKFKDVDEKFDNDYKRINKVECDIEYIKKTQTQLLQVCLVILDELKKNNDVDGVIDKTEQDMQQFLINR